MSYILEALRRLNEEDDSIFSITDDDLDRLEKFRNGDTIDKDEEDQAIQIYDLDKHEDDDEEDGKEVSYVGKVIIECPVCHSLIYKDKDELVDEVEDYIGSSENNSCDDDGLVNRGEECPYCYSTNGFNVVGKVEEYSESEEGEDIDIDDDSDEHSNDIENNEEDRDYDDIEDDEDEDDEDDEDTIFKDEPFDYEDDEDDEEDEEDVKTESFHSGKVSLDKVSYLLECYIPDVSSGCNDLPGFAAYNSCDGMKNYICIGGKFISLDNNVEPYSSAQNCIDCGSVSGTVKSLCDLINNSDPDSCNIKSCSDPSNMPKYMCVDGIHFIDLDNPTTCESLREDINNIDISTDDQNLSISSGPNGEMQVKTSPINRPVEDEDVDINAESGDEIISPLEPEDIADIEDTIENNSNEEEPEAEDQYAEEPLPEDEYNEEPLPEDEYNEEPEEPAGEEEFENEEIPVNDFNNESFNRVVGKYLNEVYDNVNSFTCTGVSQPTDSSLVVEGLIKFNSGNKHKTSFVFSDGIMMRNKVITFKGLNENISQSNRAYSLQTVLKKDTLFAKSLSYNYKTNSDGKIVTIRGMAN